MVAYRSGNRLLSQWTLVSLTVVVIFLQTLCVDLLAADEVTLETVGKSSVGGASKEARFNADLSLILNAEDARHLLARTGIGVTPADLLRFTGLPRGQAIDTIIEGMQSTPTVPMPDWVRAAVPHYHRREDMGDNERAIFNNERDAELSQLRQWWIVNMLQTNSPQTERLVLFWHDLFATSYYDTDRQSIAMARQNQTFRNKGLGAWEDLLKAMIRDPALLQFLDASSNHKDSPNENLARELLELFTLGEGNYDELQVQEAARSLTGFDFSYIHDLSFKLNSWQQDRDRKTLFGVTGPHTGDDLIDLILAQPVAAEFLATRFWHAYVSDAVPNIEWLASVSAVFRQSGHDIATLYRATLQSRDFWDSANRGMLIKSPVDLLVGTARSLEYPKQQWRSIARWQAALGMELFAPPNVSGWQEGAAFVTSGRLLARYDAIESLLNDSQVLSDDAPMQSEEATVVSNKVMAHGMSTEKTRRMAHGRLHVRVAAENYQGPVQYKVMAYDGSELLWSSEPVPVMAGQDTERFGRIGDQNELIWSMDPVPVPGEKLEKADRIDIAFVNDAAGVDGDRNLYVEGLQLDGRWFSSTRAAQRSECPPRLTADSGKLYCAGTVAFDLGASLAPVPQELPAWRASSVHVQWADQDVQDNWQTAQLILTDLVTPAMQFHTLRLRLKTNAEQPARLELDTFGCWPDCFTPWPACAWTDEHFPARRILVFPTVPASDPYWSSDATEACHYFSLAEEDRQLVGMLWHNVVLILDAARRTARAVRFNKTLDSLARQIKRDTESLQETPYAPVTLRIDPHYAPDVPIRKILQADEPHVGNMKQLSDWLQDKGFSVAQLLLPVIPAVGKSDPALDAASRVMDTLNLQSLVRSSLFQVK